MKMNSDSRIIFGTVFGNTAFEMGTVTHDKLKHIYFAMAYYQYTKVEDIEGIQKCAKYCDIKQYERTFNNIKYMTTGIEERIENLILYIAKDTKNDVDYLIRRFNENKELRYIIKRELEKSTENYLEQKKLEDKKGKWWLN